MHNLTVVVSRELRARCARVRKILLEIEEIHRAHASLDWDVLEKYVGKLLVQDARERMDRRNVP